MKKKRLPGCVLLIKPVIILVWLHVLIVNPLQAQKNNFDSTWVHRIHLKSSIRSDKFFRFVSNTSTPFGLITPVTLFTVGAFQNNETLKRNSYRFTSTLALSSALTYTLKICVKRERPFVIYPAILKKSKGGSWSFPSGHTSFAFATATSLTLTFPRWYVAAPAYAWAALVGYSRIYLGVHFPSDVLGGMVIGIGTGFLIWKLDEWFLRN